MTYANTTLLGLNQPTTGSESGVWGDDVNNGFTQLVDISVAGTNNITQDSDITLSVTNGNNSSSFSTTGSNSTVAQYAVLNCTGSRTAARNIIVPASSKLYVVYNNTSGGYAITVKKSSGTGVSIANGEKALCYYDSITATDVIKVLSTTTLGTVTTGTWNASVIGAAYGGTGVANNAANTITFTGNYSLGLTLTANTSVTLPTSGTLVNTAVTTLSSLVSVGTITTGTWNASLITGTYGGTGVNNGSSTITIGGNVTFSGAYTTSLTVSANTSVTLPTSGTLGYQNIPQNSQSTAYTTVAADAGYCIFHPSSDANARTFTIAANASVPYAIGTVIQFINMSANNVTIAINSDTMYLSGAGTTGSRTLAQYGVANAVKMTTTTWLITGSNLT